MANVLVEESSLSAIASAIRARNGGSTTYKPSEMAAAIETIETIKTGVDGINHCLRFFSLSDFTLNVNDSAKHWNGTLEWTDGRQPWAVWDGTTTLSSSDGALYLRGTGNTVITGKNGSDYKWVLTGTNIGCYGNIETLLDYATVANGQHPSMTDYCYSYMFSGCKSLTTAPALPATALAEGCYFYMFQSCASLTTAPALPATTLADRCYSYMFSTCASLTTAPALPATTLADRCYSNMFFGCTSLAKPPALPATTLVSSCYSSMFYGCTSLMKAPALKATTLANSCYNNMFYNCASLKLSTTKTGAYQYAYRIPTSGTGTTATDALTSMFSITGGTFTGTPTINTTYYTDHAPVTA